MLSGSLSLDSIVSSPFDAHFLCPFKTPSSELERGAAPGQLERMVSQYPCSFRLGSWLGAPVGSLRGRLGSTHALVATLLRQGRLVLLDPRRNLRAARRLQEWHAGQKLGALTYWKKKLQEEAGSESDAALAEREASLLEAVWVWPSGPGETEEKPVDLRQGVAPGDALLLKVDSEGLMPGDRVSFTIYRADREGEEAKVTVVSGFVGHKRDDSCAVARWSVSPEIGGEPSEGLELYFIACMALKKLECRGEKIRVFSAKTFVLSY